MQLKKTWLTQVPGTAWTLVPRVGAFFLRITPTGLRAQFVVAIGATSATAPFQQRHIVVET